VAVRHIVVDGSNVATEGRQTPSLAQLESALEELGRDFPDAAVTVVVDATFAHRIDSSELDRYQQLANSGALVSPPAGAIGRGDAFLLRIAEKVSATVLSNDSFQEFHGEHPWLFEQGRLLGATPVPGIGWIFSARSPVRGPRSRVATRDAKRAQDEVADAIEVATREAVEPEEHTESRPRSRRTRSSAVSPPAVNDPMTFISFIAEHHLGSELEADVESFTSHGAVVRFGEVRCYVPLSGLGDPPPRSARGILSKAERRTFVITALDPFRRGIELALPGLAVVSGRPSEETVQAEVAMARRTATAAAPATATRRRTRTSTAPAEGEETPPRPPEPTSAPAAPAPRRRRTTAEKAPGGRAVPPAAPEPASAPTPTKRTRTPRTTARVAVVPAPVADGDGVASASPPPVPPPPVPPPPVAPRRRRSPAGATATVELAPAPPAPSGAPARRRRAAPKTEAPAAPVETTPRPEPPAAEPESRPGPRRRPRAAGAGTR